jgi:hypothetical protein
MTVLSRRYLVAFLILLLSFLASPAFSQDGMGSVKVLVKDFYSDEPVADAQVLITPCNYTGTTNGDGEAVLENVAPFRNYQVEVLADGYIEGAAGFVSAEGGEETVLHISLKQKSTITGRVRMQLLLIFQWPLANATVELQEIRDRSFVTIEEIQTDFLGRYSFENIEETTYRISAQAEGFLSEFVDIEIEGGKNATQHFTLKRQWERGQGEPPIDLQDSKEHKPSSIKVAHSISSPHTCRVMPRLHNAATQFYAEPEAVPSLIPGPSELPYLYNDQQIFTSSSGSQFVSAGATVYLRGFAIDQDLLAPQEFNPDAPCFDIYGNKNGNFSASIFSYSWTLKDESGDDYSSLLNPSPTMENVSFTIPEDFKAGDYFTASLTVADDQSIAGTPEEITITVAESVDETSCVDCHSDNVAGYLTTMHAQVEGGAGCQDCHGLGSEHPDSGKMTVSDWPGVCGQCHGEFAEMQKANHTDPLPYGYYEPAGDYLAICYRCHYTSGYIGAVESGKPFHEFHYDADILPEIPKDSPNISCSICHDPHPQGESPYGLRTGSVGSACDTCHYEKWHNAILEGLGGTFGNAYHYPGEDYTPFLGENNPHRTEDKCVSCHMDTTQTVTDENGVLKIGGHTFRMRDFGGDMMPDTDDDILNITVCQKCHAGAATFDIEGVQTEMEDLIMELSNLLKSNNHEFLPANEPGNCARCHKGGTVPFLNDPENILENAYTNYKLIINDRSRGVHNPGYVRKLLQDSIDSIHNNY